VLGSTSDHDSDRVEEQISHAGRSERSLDDRKDAVLQHAASPIDSGAKHSEHVTVWS
jgi:hypothetical protein